MNNQKLYEYAKQVIFDQGGDGDAVIVSRNYYKELAEDFIKWETSLDHPWLIRRSDAKKAIVFYPIEEYSQEAIIFAEELMQVDIFMYDAVIFVGNYVGVE